MKVQALFLKNLLDYSAFQGINTDTLKSYMVNPGVDLNHPDEMVDAKDYINVFEHIIEKQKKSYCGLSIGAYLNLSSLGLVLDISLSTSSIKQGIYILEKYLKSKFPIVSFKIIEDSHRYALKFDSSVGNKSVKRELLNMVLYIVYRELNLMLPNNLIPQIRFPFPKKEQANLFFNDMVVRYHDDHVVLLPENFDELEINSIRMKEIELLLPKFVAMLNQSDHNSNEFSDKVKAMALNMCNPEIPNLEQVLKQFACSKRTFQRRLTAEGTSFRKIVNEIKEELSHYLINEKNLRTKDIAYILGYSESSAYLHALNAWRNKSKKEGHTFSS